MKADEVRWGWGTFYNTELYPFTFRVAKGNTVTKFNEGSNRFDFLFQNKFHVEKRARGFFQEFTEARCC